MLHRTSKPNKRIKSIKVRSQRYIKNTEEPRDSTSRDTLAKDETILVEDMPVMKRRFRLIAKNVRIIRFKKKREQS